MTTEFNPNEPQDVPDHLWGTHIPNSHSKNRGDWKTHRSLKDVRAALDTVHGYYEVSVWRRTDPASRWEKVAYFDRKHPVPLRDPDHCHVCGEGSAQYRTLWPKWSADEDFAKVQVHFGACERKLGVRR